MPLYNSNTFDMPIDKEFYVPVEVYIPAKAAATLRKAPSNKKVPDRRDSTRLASGSSDGNLRRVKEKSSWLSLSRGSPGMGQWSTATCRLTEEDEGCLLNVYVEDTILYKTVYVYLLNHTDIRQVHHSLFDRKDCLGVHGVAGQMWSASSIADPLYLHFADTELMKMWLVLLRSYAMPEVYGRWLAPDDGGLYRMWRQVKLTCLQGRNLGTSRSPIDETPGGDSELDALDIDVSCEIYINGSICGRTTVKKGIGSPDWHEHFTFSDLPPFENLEIVVCRERRLARTTMIGSVMIVLPNFRRGDHVEGWFPVLSNSHQSVQAGELRLNIRVDEEIILPYDSYSDMLQTLGQRNYLDWLQELELRLKLKSISNDIIAIAVAKNTLIEHMMDIADREVDIALTAHNTLFRGNTVFTKTMEAVMSWYGSAFLEASIGPIIRRICRDKVSIEVDPLRSGRGTRGLEKNVEVLVYWCQEFWTHIYDARRTCPQEMRRLFAHIRHLVEKRHQDDPNRELPWQSVSAFCFLRFIVPAILHPHLFGLWPGLPDAPVQRSLTLVAKVIMSLANLNATAQKEEFMRGVKQFLTNSIQAMIDYIVVVSTVDSPEHGSHASRSSVDNHERLRIINSLHQRVTATSTLHREATPLLPHLLDVPKHLAVVTSLVVRYSRANPDKPIASDPNWSPSEEKLFREFCAKCLEVESRALHRVSKLATKPKRHSTSQKRTSDSIITTVSVHAAPTSPVFSPREPRERKISSPQKHREKRSARPSTAPSLDSAVQLSTTETKTHRSPKSRRQIISPVSPGSSSYDDPDPGVGDNAPGKPCPPPSAYYPRSTSTDSAIIDKPTSREAQSQTGNNSASDNSDDQGKKRKGILRGIWSRK